MDRRTTGVLALVLALAAMLFVPRVLNPGLAGSGSPAAMPAPPPVGSCVVMTRRPMAVVDCAEQHQGEVTARWLAEDPLRPVQATDEWCLAANRAYVGAGIPDQLRGWKLTVLESELRVARAPRSARVGGYGWNACVLRAPHRAYYTGTVRALPEPADRPDVFGSCYTAPPYGPILCTEAHTVERLAETRGTWFDTQSGLGPGSRTHWIQATLRGDCLEIAQQLTGNEDPSYAGLLEVGVGVLQLEQFAIAEDPQKFGTRYLAMCQLTVTDGALTGSVVGLGGGALPVR